MWMVAEIVDPSGDVVVGAAADIVEEGDLPKLVREVTARFRRNHPDTSLLSELNQPGYQLRISKGEA